MYALTNRTSAAPSSAAKKPPKMENVGSKWYIENFDGNEELQVTDPSPKTAVLFVKNTKSFLQVRHGSERTSLCLSSPEDGLVTDGIAFSQVAPSIPNQHVLYLK
jgi:hypothetical protein